jgi:hypothetical protein
MNVKGTQENTCYIMLFFIYFAHDGIGSTNVLYNERKVLNYVSYSYLSFSYMWYFSSHNIGQMDWKYRIFLLVYSFGSTNMI